jgi:urease gamma subunit
VDLGPHHLQRTVVQVVLVAAPQMEGRLDKRLPPHLGKEITVELVHLIIQAMVLAVVGAALVVQAYRLLIHLLRPVELVAQDKLGRHLPLLMVSAVFLLVAVVVQGIQEERTLVELVDQVAEVLDHLHQLQRTQPLEQNLQVAVEVDLLFHLQPKVIAVQVAPVS